MSQSRKPQGQGGGLRALLPVFGLIVAVVFGVVGWLIAPDALKWFEGLIPGFTGSELDPTVMRIIVTVVIALLALVLFALIAALVTPKPTLTAREADLAREKERLLAQQKAERDRQRRSGR
ncbi:MAG: hypothetical protein JNL42_14740 [Anaerolineae bacterium]|nr:hypothetical protein [Anaerolineae bacterium]